MTRVTLAAALEAGALPWALKTVHNKAAGLPWLVRQGPRRPILVEVEPAAAWLLASGWEKKADRLLDLKQKIHEAAGLVQQK